jgi:hypothetical protein
VDCRAAAAWAHRLSFVPPLQGATQADSGTARADSVPTQGSRGTQRRTQPNVEGAGHGQHQACDSGEEVFGVSGTLMLEALVRGGSTLAEIADLAQGRLRRKIPELLPALGSHRDASPGPRRSWGGSRRWTSNSSASLGRSPRRSNRTRRSMSCCAPSPASTP